MPNGQEFILIVFKEIVVHTFPLKKVGNGLSLASLQVSRLTVGVILNLIIPSYPFLFIFLLQVTPTANRNSYRVARLVGAVTQGSVLRPQPWAGESQLRQSCCCLRAAVYMYSFRCCYLRAALHMYSLRCCRLEGPGCVSHPPFIASIR